MENKINSFKDLEVWKVAHTYVLAIYKTTASFPKTEEYRLTNQLIRASISIPANIAEGCGRKTTAELTHFLTISRGSTEECKYFLILSKDLGYIDAEEFTNLNYSLDSIGKMLNGLLNKLKQKLTSTTNHQSQNTTHNG
jgi:four helix bundle protein